MIRASNLSYAVGKQPILQEVNCLLEPGKLTVLLGSNGAGKSTLLKILAGSLSPVSGTVAWKGKPFSAIPVAAMARERAVLTQHYSVSMPFRCEEIVLMGRYPHFSGKPAAFDERVVAEAMELVQVTSLAGRYFQRLSGGEQQRVQLARVLAQLWPANERDTEKCMLLDEPVSSMDVLYQQKCLQTARQMAARGFAVVVVLHDLNLAAQFADEIILLRKGRVIATGDARAVLKADLIRQAYDYEVEVVYHENYPFPMIVPALSKNTFLIQTKIA